MAYFKGPFQGGGFFGPMGSQSGNFFGGPFFGGGFFGELEESEQEQPVVAPPKTDDGAPKKAKSIVKPTGLLHGRRKTVAARIQETAQIHREVLRASRPQPKPVAKMSLHEIEAEIAVRLREKIQKEDEETMVLLIMASSL